MSAFTDALTRYHKLLATIDEGDRVVYMEQGHPRAKGTVVKVWVAEVDVAEPLDYRIDVKLDHGHTTIEGVGIGSKGHIRLLDIIERLAELA